MYVIKNDVEPRRQVDRQARPFDESRAVQIVTLAVLCEQLGAVKCTNYWLRYNIVEDLGVP